MTDTVAPDRLVDLPAFSDWVRQAGDARVLEVSPAALLDLIGRVEDADWRLRAFQETKDRAEAAERRVAELEEGLREFVQRATEHGSIGELPVDLEGPLEQARSLLQSSAVSQGDEDG